MSSRSTHPSATFQREINGIFQPLAGIESVIDMKIDADQDGGLVVFANIDDILIATMGAIEKHRKQVVKVFDLYFENNLCVQNDTCYCDHTAVALMGFLVNGKSIRIDLKNAQAIVDWPRPTYQ